MATLRWLDSRDASCSGQDPIIYGDLRRDDRRFVSCYRFHQLVHRATDKTEKEMAPGTIGALLAKWKYPLNWADQLAPEFLDYECEKHDGDPLP